MCSRPHLIAIDSDLGHGQSCYVTSSPLQTANHIKGNAIIRHPRDERLHMSASALVDSQLAQPPPRIARRSNYIRLAMSFIQMNAATDGSSHYSDNQQND